MTKLQRTCDECDSKFTIQYDENLCEDDPTFCPFCASYLIDEEDTSSDAYEDDE